MTAELPDEIKEKFPEKLTEALQNLLKNPEYLSMLISGITQSDRNRIMQWMSRASVSFSGNFSFISSGSSAIILVPPEQIF